MFLPIWPLVTVYIFVISIPLLLFLFPFLCPPLPLISPSFLSPSLFPSSPPPILLKIICIYMIVKGCPRRCGIQSLTDLDLPQLVSACIYTSCMCIFRGRVIGLSPLDVYEPWDARFKLSKRKLLYSFLSWAAFLSVGAFTGRRALSSCSSVVFQKRLSQSVESTSWQAFWKSAYAYLQFCASLNEPTCCLFLFHVYA